MRSVRSLALCGVLGCFLVGGCGGGKTVARGKIANEIQVALAKKGFTAPVKSVTCPKDLDAKVGANESCRLTYQSGSVLLVSATITSVTGGTAQFHFLVTKKLR